MSIPNTPDEIKPLAPETVSYVGEGEIVETSIFKRLFWPFIIVLVVLLTIGIWILVNNVRPHVTIENPVQNSQN